MTELSPEALNSLSREEPIALIVQLFAEVRRLQAEVDLSWLFIAFQIKNARDDMV